MGIVPPGAIPPRPLRSGPPPGWASPNFAIYTGGRELPGTFPLFLVPVSVTLAVVLLRRMKLGTCPGGIPGGALGIGLCAAGVGLGLALGVPALLAALGV